MNQSIGIVITMVLSVVVACASAPGTRPHDMSTTEHARVAGEHERMGTDHEARFRPASRDATHETDCAHHLGSCWASNPTERHRDEARKHRALAMKQRAASESLRHAEATACVGLSDADRDVSPFVHREAIVRVAPLVVDPDPSGYDALGGASSTEQVGATIVLRAEAGLTAERLQRAVTCHLARAASLGHEAPELSFCPLAVKGVKASVSSTGDAFAVNVSAESREGAVEVLARAERLVAR